MTAGEAAALLQRGFATYGSDSGHQQAGFGPRGGAAPAAPPDNDWTLSDEAIKNLGYMQLKKTHDAAMVLLQRVYGGRPRYNYFIGTSQGGREALTVAQRAEPGSSVSARDAGRSRPWRSRSRNRA